MTLKRLTSIVAWIVLATLLGACANPNAMRIADPESHDGVPQGASIHRILVATTRERDEDPTVLFSGERETALSFAAIDVSVPPGHQTGQTERPSQGRLDPKKHFYAQRVEMLADQGDFSGRIQPGKDVMVFIHGYRNNFADALFRITQIVHDTGFTGTAVLFSWASRGSTVEYIYDRDSATAARDSLESTLRALGSARPNRIDVIAHSMGSWVTMEAMRQLKIGGDADLGGRLGDVILASPDISADVFKAQMARYGTPAKPFFILMSRDDKALRLSQFIAGNKPRLGDYSDTEDLAKLGVIVVDLTSVGNADRLNHTKFAQNPALVRLLGERLRQGENFNPQRVSAEDGLLTLTAGVGAAVTGTARVIITTPRKVFSTAVPQ